MTRLQGWGRIAIAVTLAVTQVSEAADNEGGPCTEAVAHGRVCQAANQRALESMKAGKLEAIIVMQDVRTGNLIAFAASNPPKFDVTTPLPPLSPVKLITAASALDQPDMKIAGFPASEKLLDDSIVSGNDNAGRRIASDLRTTVGTDKVLQDLERYGFPAGPKESGKIDLKFWNELAPRWRLELLPAAAYHSLGQETTAKDWEDTLSLGEQNFIVTALHLSRFLQAVGNEGLMLPAAARDEDGPGSTIAATGTRVMSEVAAVRLQAVMHGTVERGTAKRAAPILAGTGWTMGGKTGTGPDPGSKAPGPGSDGCFAGLIFDPQGKARFTIVTYVKHGGLGGGNAARLSAELALFLSGARASSAP